MKLFFKKRARNVSFLVFVFPLVASAAFSSVADFIGKVADTIGLFFPLLLGVMSVLFLYSVFNFMVAGQGDESKRNDARKMIVYAVIGFFVVMSIWGLVAFMRNVFNIQGDEQAPTPIQMPN